MQYFALSCCTTGCLLFVQEHTLPAAGAANPASKKQLQHRPLSIIETTRFRVLLGTCLLLWLCTLFPLKNFAPALTLKGARRKFLLVEQGLTQTCQSACHTIFDAKLTARMIYAIRLKRKCIIQLFVPADGKCKEKKIYLRANPENRH